MNYRKNKLERLTRVAHLYYEEDKTQGEIATLMNISRPLVSRILQEARDVGIVEIRVHRPACDRETLQERLCQQFGLQEAVLFSDEESSARIDHDIAKRMLEFIEERQPEYLGIGWGSIIGTATKLLDRIPPHATSIRSVCPLLGNSSVSSRQYHSDENVRIIAECYGAQPVFLHAPIFYPDEEERNLLYATRHYQAVSRQWDKLDMALVGVHDTTIERDVGYPMERNSRTVGHLAGNSYDRNGSIVAPERNCIVHIPVENLTHCRCVVGLCAADVSPMALIGALRTGILTHIFLRESLAETLLEE
ncbi:MAG: sugar-binding domain-containing protein [Clostridiales bacterium]|nr:sugar-binding domain-containing protein [Clostridiales bacterium]